ncbi:hypothetical protein ASPWEDRAFT_375062 [Aspergillus wentii DTO 134E9]|uniref:tRNA-splicing endonuclease subunit Sen15 domain-containing protein n=1 Tax=Aspergillus wentii DTO 134E9 TaxID=1073089 RepID=A0A1L9RX60_ASPWE|nr:uncharacterized protein ASPWEDRAFT_375062 [Aspergillus wentii DTO 134E9]KAI9931851.1 hypothetical protein MW887_010435 [Aspergillus wentii]OJJ39464.1 hypothetical protein ASPWEDRAFT_375062 [Aspergillus wentii DTO 134E9]
MTSKISVHPPPEPSALTNLISASSVPGHPLSATTTQILHNLQHQHLWTALHIHDIQLPTDPSSPEDQQSKSGFLISGIPPHRVYTHPDEQLYMLERGLRDADIELERMFVLPTVQGQSWSLRKMAAVFDSLPEGEEEPSSYEVSDKEDKAAKLQEYYEYRTKARATKEWGSKRLLLAMVDKGMGGDGTVVYYVVQEGAVKPRQN